MISGTGGALTKIGTGTQTLTGANTYSGGTTVSAGALLLGNDTAAGTNTITLAGGTLGNSANGVVNTNAIDVTADSILAVGSFRFGILMAISRAAETSPTPMPAPLPPSRSVATTVVILARSPRLAIPLMWTFSSATAGSASAAWSLNNSTSGFTDFGGFSGTIDFGSLAGSAAGVTNLTAGTVTMSVGALNTSTTFSGALLSGTGVIALTKVGTGTVTFAGANTYTGATTVSSGTLEAAAAGALGGTTSVTLNTGGTLLLSNARPTGSTIRPRSAWRAARSPSVATCRKIIAWNRSADVDGQFDHRFRERKRPHQLCG